MTVIAYGGAGKEKELRLCRYAGVDGIEDAVDV
jgi:hypothetical protein